MTGLEKLHTGSDESSQSPTPNSVKAKVEKLRGAEVLAELGRVLKDRRDQKEKLYPAARRERRIWTGILGYVNADLSADAQAYATLLGVLRELTLESAEFGGSQEFKGISFYLSDLANTAARNNFLSLTLHYQRPLRNLLLWLCEPKSHAELRHDALRLLEFGARGESWKIDLNENPITQPGWGDFDETKDRPILYFVKEVKYASIVSPVCKFILDYVDDPREKGLPIRICKRPGCEKLILPERVGRKEFCSSLCGSRVAQQKKSPVLKADYAWLHRLEKEPKATLQLKLKKDQVKTRLREIEARWPVLREKARAVRARLS
jgi:hypothetical protein